MKKFLVFLLFLMSFGSVLAQTRVIVVMAEKYDDADLSVKTRNMTKAERRDFVIQERMAFCQASQQNVMEFLNGLKDEVSGIEQYWGFNGFRCNASEDVIAMLEKRADVAYVYRDEKRQMIPDFGEAKPVENRDMWKRSTRRQCGIITARQDITATVWLSLSLTRVSIIIMLT